MSWSGLRGFVVHADAGENWCISHFSRKQILTSCAGDGSTVCDLRGNRSSGPRFL